jgi:small subunit ribosomal protein S6
MRRYETIFIMDPDLNKDDRAPLLEKVQEFIPTYDGFLVEVDEWGARKLAYDIKKKQRGYYVRLDYCGTGTLVNEMERYFRISDQFLKYMTVLLDKDVDMEALKARLAEAEAEKAAAAAAKAGTETAERAATEKPAEAEAAKPPVESAPAAAPADGPEPVAEPEEEPEAAVETEKPQTPSTENDQEGEK